MTVDEAKSAIQELKAQGLTDEGIAASLYKMYTEDKLDLDQFGSLVKLVGFDLSDEFMELPDEEKKKQNVGEFGMSDEGEESNESSSSENDGAEDEEPKEDEQKEEEEENPYETPEKKSSDEDDKEYKDVYGD